MKIDILFIDIACSKPYNWDSLENDSIGGTESSTIRLAEGFASMGHSVAILQKYDFMAQQSPNNVWYLPMSWIDQIQPKNVIHLRFRGLLNRFPHSKQFVWLHDASKIDHNNMHDWPIEMVKYSAQGIAVSDWHIKNIHQFAPDMPLKRIYSPVDETCYTYPRMNHDKNQLVWMSSPHKGLSEAIEIFKELYDEDNHFKLAVFNPGYHEEEAVQHPGIRYIPKCKKSTMRAVVAQSLCVFYPTKFEETFGLIAAEANALGTPVACYKIAALAESCNNPFAWDCMTVKDTVIAWQTDRPVTVGNENFRFEKIYPQWLELFNL